MGVRSTSDATELLLAWSDGDRSALERLFPIVYVELRKVAEVFLRRKNPDHSLQSNILVNEAYARLVNPDKVRWQDRSRFLAMSARLMRRVLVDLARAKKRVRRGDSQVQLAANAKVQPPFDRDLDVIALDEALSRLTKLNRRHGKIVEMRYFAGLTDKEIAEELGISSRTVRRNWSVARAWLNRELTAKL
ncbi:MAG: ECF-type sigma factor [Pyrinomonadaceae bacterium]